MKSPSPAGTAHRRRRVLVVDDHPLMRESITRIVNRAPDLTVCGEAGSVEGAVAGVEECSPDIVVSDLALLGENGFNLVEKICAERPDLPVLILSMHSDALHAQRALQAGAAGYVMKGEGGELLVPAIRRVLAGNVHFSERVRKHVLQHLGQRTAGDSASPFATLTPEEWLIFEASSRREPEAVAALSLGLTAGELRLRRQAIRRKLHLANDAALRHHALLWIEAGRPAF